MLERGWKDPAGDTLWFQSGHSFILREAVPALFLLLFLWESQASSSLYLSSNALRHTFIFCFDTKGLLRKIGRSCSWWEKVVSLQLFNEYFKMESNRYRHKDRRLSWYDVGILQEWEAWSMKKERAPCSVATNIVSVSTDKIKAKLWFRQEYKHNDTGGLWWIKRLH